MKPKTYLLAVVLAFVVWCLITTIQDRFGSASGRVIVNAVFLMGFLAAIGSLIALAALRITERRKPTASVHEASGQTEATDTQESGDSSQAMHQEVRMPTNRRTPKVAFISLLAAAILVFCIAPVKQVSYTTTERYQATEVYYESEPYVVREEYTEVQEQAVTQRKSAVLLDKLFTVRFGVRTYQTYIDIKDKSSILVKGQFTRHSGFPEVYFYVSDDTDPSLNVGTPTNPIVAAGSVGAYMFSFVPRRTGTYYFRFECYYAMPKGDLKLNVNMEWQETVVKRQEVTKYRDVTKYEEVQRERVVWKERPVTSSKRVSLLRYLLGY